MISFGEPVKGKQGKPGLDGLQRSSQSVKLLRNILVNEEQVCIVQVAEKRILRRRGFAEGVGGIWLAFSDQPWPRANRHLSESSPVWANSSPIMPRVTSSQEPAPLFRPPH